MIKEIKYKGYKTKATTFILMLPTLLKQQRYLEIIRVLLVMMLVGLYVQSGILFFVGLLIITVISTQEIAERWYFRLVYGRFWQENRL